MHAKFRQKAPIVIGWLTRDFGLKDFQAAGIVGNIGRECLGFTVLREIGAKGDRGGWGWCQWTGPRARSFRNWAASRKLDWRSDAANYGYLKHDLSGDYAGSIAAVKACATLERATEVFERSFEKAGVPAIVDRIAWAREALEAYRASVSKDTLKSADKMIGG